jgi:hypothetical protein
MPPGHSQEAVPEPNELLKSAWHRIKACLEEARHQIHDEIRTYPRPIPACDQQFNYLLERRARVSHELALLDEASAESPASGDSMARIDGFIDSSTCLEENAKQGIRSYLREGLARLEAR